MRVKAFGKLVEFDEGTPRQEVKKVLSKLDPEYPIKAQSAAIEGLKDEVRQCSDASTKLLLEAQTAHCDAICKAIEANKPTEYKAFTAERVSDGKYHITIGEG